MSKLGEFQNISESRGPPITPSQKEEIARLKSLEEEKIKLQLQLEEAKTALNSYAAKLESQVRRDDDSLKYGRQR